MSLDDALDALALASVPERFPQIPRNLDRKHLDHRVTLEYRNPLIATSSR